MKKTLCIILAAATMLCMFAACGKADQTGAENGEAASADSIVQGFQTMGDAIEYKGATYVQWAAVDKLFFYVFDLGNATYRVVADFDGNIPDDFFENDFSTDEGKAAIKKLVGNLAITKAENLTANMPAQEDMAQFVGKKGQDMLAAGWKTSGIDFENNVFFMSRGVYSCDVAVEEKLKETEDYDAEALFKDATIKSVTNIDIGDAAYVEEAQ